MRRPRSSSSTPKGGSWHRAARRTTPAEGARRAGGSAPGDTRPIRTGLPILSFTLIGNPVLIGLVLVWKLKDTYKAMFEIDAQTMAEKGNGQVSVTVAGRMNAFEAFVRVQSDAALRQVAGEYAYDDNEHDKNELTLRGGGEEINNQLEHQLNERLAMAGMEVVEARINYLAYAPEIAAVMLRRQQASAIITAREKIVEGAVSMVKMALDKLSSCPHIGITTDQRSTASISFTKCLFCFFIFIRY